MRVSVQWVRCHPGNRLPLVLSHVSTQNHSSGEGGCFLLPSCHTQLARIPVQSMGSFNLASTPNVSYVSSSLENKPWNLCVNSAQLRWYEQFPSFEAGFCKAAALQRVGGVSQWAAKALVALPTEESGDDLWVACGQHCPFHCCARHWGCFWTCTVDKALTLSHLAGIAAGTLLIAWAC